eukprot:TRINITY_DN9248_c0_g1_i4.p2 TRINITY_DN9248_c0_g1~~TRINITY_DN9248_c0_g1_i4.p2  ORF type:complete len:125 (+),score=10.09 TRINITY_DN9248_c0_g1_i4:299-673(+)
MFFLEYYFHDQIPLPAGVRAETAVSYALIPLFICAALSSLVSGKLSDHFGGRRRVFVVTSAVVMAVSALLMALIQVRCSIVLLTLAGQGIFKHMIVMLCARPGLSCHPGHCGCFWPWLRLLRQC